jgi:hypothetical protein
MDIGARTCLPGRRTRRARPLIISHTTLYIIYGSLPHYILPMSTASYFLSSDISPLPPRSRHFEHYIHLYITPSVYFHFTLIFYICPQSLSLEHPSHAPLLCASEPRSAARVFEPCSALVFAPWFACPALPVPRTVRIPDNIQHTSTPRLVRRN